MTVQSKVYLEIVQKIRTIIEEDDLKAGDRLPSERELSARLHVGRSSVREALRSLELVGLIETRRGEGTFIKNYSEHGLVKLLAPFLLHDEKSKEELKQIKQLIEQSILRLLCLSGNGKDLCNQLAVKELSELSIIAINERFWSKAVEQTNNSLLYRIWLIINEYISTLTCEFRLESNELYYNICEAIQNRDEARALLSYNQLVEKIVYK